MAFEYEELVRVSEIADTMDNGWRDEMDNTNRTRSQHAQEDCVPRTDFLTMVTCTAKEFAFLEKTSLRRLIHNADICAFVPLCMSKLTMVIMLLMHRYPEWDLLPRSDREAIQSIIGFV